MTHVERSAFTSLVEYRMERGSTTLTLTLCSKETKETVGLSVSLGELSGAAATGGLVPKPDPRSADPRYDLSYYMIVFAGSLDGHERVSSRPWTLHSDPAKPRVIEV